MRTTAKRELKEHFLGTALALEELKALSKINTVLEQRTALSQEASAIAAIHLRSINQYLGIPLQPNIATEQMDNIQIHANCQHAYRVAAESIFDVFANTIKKIAEKMAGQAKTQPIEDLEKKEKEIDQIKIEYSITDALFYDPNLETGLGFLSDGPIGFKEIKLFLEGFERNVQALTEVAKPYEKIFDLTQKEVPKVLNDISDYPYEKLFGDLKVLSEQTKKIIHTQFHSPNSSDMAAFKDDESSEEADLKSVRVSDYTAGGSKIFYYMDADLDRSDFEDDYYSTTEIVVTESEAKKGFKRLKETEYKKLVQLNKGVQKKFSTLYSYAIDQLYELSKERPYVPKRVDGYIDENLLELYVQVDRAYMAFMDVDDAVITLYHDAKLISSYLLLTGSENYILKN